MEVCKTKHEDGIQTLEPLPTNLRHYLLGHPAAPQREISTPPREIIGLLPADNRVTIWHKAISHNKKIIIKEKKRSNNMTESMQRKGFAHLSTTTKQ
ncbi:hypothetical protein Y032_0003g1662 [Ancylostoma ceylanicum]|nr:hypothetical protein Y032_0003g1662 [Ancylostoma ceylanicum]